RYSSICQVLCKNCRVPVDRQPETRLRCRCYIFLSLAKLCLDMFAYGLRSLPLLWLQHQAEGGMIAAGDNQLQASAFTVFQLQMLRFVQVNPFDLAVGGCLKPAKADRQQRRRTH